MIPEARNTQDEIAPVVKSLTVPLPQEEAFSLFTEGLGEWWPLETHSVAGAEARGAELEGRVGGRIFETGPGGSESEWGRILSWDPPRLVVFSWHPGREPGSAQEVEVVFAPAEAGSTLVRLEHRGWEALGEAALEMRADYDPGWTFVLGHYERGAARTP